MIHEPAGGGHHNLGLALQLLYLSADARAAVEHRYANALKIGQQAPQFVTDLDGQLPGRSKDQALNRFVGRVDVFDHGDAKGKGLAGAGGGLCDDILPLHKMRNGFRLNGGGIAVALALQRFQHGLTEAKAFKCYFHVFLSFFCT